MKKILFLLILWSAGMYSQPVKKDVCKPILVLNGHKSGDTLAKSELSKLSGLTIYYPCSKTVSNTIRSYILSVFNGTSGGSFGGFGHRLTSKMKDGLKDLPSGSKILIDFVKIKDREKEVSDIAGLTFFVGTTTSSALFEIDTAGLTKIPSCDPVLLIGKYKAGANITKNELNLIDRLSTYSSCNIGKKYNGCNVDQFPEVVSYEVSATINEKIFSLKCTSSEFPKEIREQFREIKSTTELTLSNIQVKYPNGSAFGIPPVVLHVNPVPKKEVKGSDFTRTKKIPAK